VSWNPYGTIGPRHIPGMTHREYFERYRTEIAQQHEDDDVDTTPIILYQVTSAPLTRLHPLVSKLYQGATKVAQSVSCGASAAYVPGAPFKTGEREGERRPDKIVRQWWLYAVYDGKVLRVTYAAEDTWLSYGTAKCVNRQLGWQQLSDKQLKELLSCSGES